MTGDNELNARLLQRPCNRGDLFIALVEKVEAADHGADGAVGENGGDFADDVRRKYFELIKDKKVLCECGLIEGKE